MIFGEKKIKKLVEQGKLIIIPYDLKKLSSDTLDVTLTPHFRFYPFPTRRNPAKAPVNPLYARREGYLRDTVPVTLREGQGILLPPGGMILGITEEEIKLPKNIAGTLEGKSGYGRRGILTHATAGFLHPGSDGRTVLEIINTHHDWNLIEPADRAQIRFSRVKGGKRYRGEFQRQSLDLFLQHHRPWPQRGFKPKFMIIDAAKFKATQERRAQAAQRAGRRR